MCSKLLFSFFISFPFLLKAQTDTTSYQKKYAFKTKNIEYEKGASFFLMDNLYKVWNGSSFMWGFYDMKNNETLTSPKFDTISYRYLHKRKKGFYRIKENGKWGMLHKDRSEWVSVAFDNINYNYGAIVDYISIENNSKYGILDTLGQIVLEANYDDISYDGFRYLVKIAGKSGMRDAKGKELIPTCFDKIYHHTYLNHINLQIGNKWSVFNWIKEDPCAFGKKYDDVDVLMDYFVVRDNDKFALLDIEGKEVLPMEYDFMAPFFLKYLRSVLVGKDKKVGVYRIDSSGKVIASVPIEYDDIWVDETTLKIKVKKKDKIDYYFNDQTLFNLVYNDLQYFPDIDRVTVKKGTKWGMLTAEGEEIIPITYSAIHIMNANQFMVKKGSKWGLLDAKGNEMIPVIYDAFDYRPKKNFFFVQKGDKWGIVSTTKGIILPPVYEDMVTLPNRTFLVKQKGLWGVAAAGGRVIVPLDYVSYNYKYKSREIILKHSDGRVKKHALL